jgi:hypothetical protein
LPDSRYVQYRATFITLPDFDLTTGNLVPGVRGPGPELQKVTIGR